MADRTIVERLQPALLDRLTDNNPDSTVEARGERVIDIDRLRDIIRRDLSWLLNTNNLESQFDAEAVFRACRANDVAVEINSRPERRDPPTRLLELALDLGCRFAIDTDAHAPGQLEFLDHGCARAQEAGIARERIVNALPMEELLAWTGRSLPS